MRNTLTDLNNYLFEMMERLLDDDMTDEQLATEIRRSQAVTAVAESIVRTGDLALQAAVYAEEYCMDKFNTGREPSHIPSMLRAE